MRLRYESIPLTNGIEPFVLPLRRQDGLASPIAPHLPLDSSLDKIQIFLSVRRFPS